MDNKKNKNNQLNESAKENVLENKNFSGRSQEGERDSFSDALLGTYSDEHIEPTVEPKIFSEDNFLDSVYSEDVLASIAQPHPTEKPVVFPAKEGHLLLPEHTDPRNRKSSVTALILLVVVFCFYLIGYGSYYISNNAGDMARKSAVDQNNPFLNIALQAKAAYVYDTRSGKVLFALNENNVLPLASLTKLMTAVIASELLPAGTVVTIGKMDIEEEGDSGLFMNERWKLSDIVGFTLMTSSNDGASALATAAGSLGQNAYGMPTNESKQKFIDAMNKKAEEFGLRGTHFFNESGLDVNKEISGGYGTARDVALLMTHVVKIAHKNIEPTTLARATITSLDNIHHQATNTNEEINAIPGIIASKTGYTDLAGGNLAIAFDAGLSHPVVVVVLGSTREGRFKDAEALTWAALQSIDK